MTPRDPHRNPAASSNLRAVCLGLLACGVFAACSGPQTAVATKVPCAELDCPASTRCQEGACVPAEPAACTTDEDCPSAACVDGRCVCACRDAADCAADQACEACSCVAVTAEPLGEESATVQPKQDTQPPPMVVEPPACPGWEKIDLDAPGDADELLSTGSMAAAVRTDRATIWTRTEVPAKVRVRWSAGPTCDEGSTGWARTSADDGLAAHFVLSGLTPGTRYRYVVDAKGPYGHRVTSRPGWFATAPTADVAFRMAFSGDISQRPKLYGLIDDAAAAGADLYISLGDWPFTDTMGVEAKTLDDYRGEHIKARAHPKVHRLMRAMGIMAIWDDHEVRNDWDGKLGEEEPDRVKTALDVWREFFPITGAPPGEAYRGFHWGPNVEIFILDLRSHRAANTARNDQEKSMMGLEQREWFLAELARSAAAFKLVVTTVPFYYGTTGKDHWVGFEAERDLVFDTIADKHITGVVFLTGDQHWLAVHHLPQGMKMFQTGALAQVPRAPLEGVPEWVLLQHKALNFGVLDYAPGSPPTLTFTAVGNQTESREDTDDPAVLYTETFSAGAGRITIKGPAQPQDWRLDGAHVFVGRGDAELPLATPGEYTLTWLPLFPSAVVPETQTKTLRDGKRITFDASAAEVPLVAFHEPFDGRELPAGWRAVDQCHADPDSKWRVRDGVVSETGNCYDKEDGDPKDTRDPWASIALEKRGTFLLNQEVRFGQGTLAARVFAGDNDGFGLMYGVADEQTYYRVAFDHDRRYARLVRAQGGVFTLLGEAKDFVPPRGHWMRLAVERAGSKHRVFVNGVLVLEADDAELGPGGLGLYGWGMNDLRFDDLMIVQAAPPAS